MTVMGGAVSSMIVFMRNRWPSGQNARATTTIALCGIKFFYEAELD
jgi:hypothetical protein